jgi:hypothetical protein
MTMAKANHKAARALLLQYLDLHPGKTVDADLDPAEAGIVGDTSHAEGGDSYHLGKDQIRTSGHRYSVDESPRDKRGLDNYASAMDIGYFKVVTKRGTFTLRDYSIWLVGLCKAGDPDTNDLREVIYSPDGKVVRRWDREGVRSSGDSSHLSHTHESEYRDADGHRMLRLATRWLQHIGLIPEENEVELSDKVGSKAYAGRTVGNVLNDLEGVRDTLIGDTAGTKAAAIKASSPIGRLLAMPAQLDAIGRSLTAAISALASKDAVDEQALAAALAPGVATLVLAGMPDTTDPVSQEEVTTAVREAFAHAFGSPA